MATYPGYNYLGPGNELYSGEPVTEVDKIAQDHDWAYAGSHKPEDIFKADWDAIKQFGKHYLTHGDFASFLGTFGLFSKTAIEHATSHVFYGMPKERGYDVPWGYNRHGKPFYNRGQRLWSDRRAELEAHNTGFVAEGEGAWDESTAPEVDAPMDMETTDAGPSGSRTKRAGESYAISPGVRVSAKQPRTDPTVEAPAAKSGSVSAGGGGGVGETNPAEVSSIITRSRFFQSWGNVFVKKYDGDDHRSIGLSLACIPVQLIMFYLSPAEFDWLPMSARVQEVNVRVTPVGTKVSFSTNEASTTWTNSTQTVFGMVARGLNRIGNFCDAKVKTRDAKKPMLVTAFEDCNAAEHWKKRLWGSSDDHFVNIASSILGIRSLPWYATMGTFGKKSDIQGYYPDLSKLSQMFEFHGFVGKPIDYHYKPRNGMLKGYKWFDINSQDTLTKGQYFTGSTQARARFAEISKTGQLTDGVSTTSTNCPNMYDIGSIENYGAMGMLKPHFGHHLQSSLHVGIHPVQANAPDEGLDTVPDFINAAAFWQVDSEIVISINPDKMYTTSGAENVGRLHQHDFFSTKTADVNKVFNNYSALGTFTDIVKV